MKNKNLAPAGALLTITFVLVLLYALLSNTSIFTTVPKATMPLLDHLSPTQYDPPTTFQLLGWIPYWDQSAAIASYRARPELFDFLGVFWYAVNEDGVIRPYPYATIDQDFVRSAQGHGTKVLAVITNLPPEDEGGDWDADRLDLVLADGPARTSHVADIMRLVESEGFDGINIDYEQMRANQRQHFTDFIQELAQALHAKNKILGVSLMPKVSESNPQFSNGSQAQDWQQLGQHADHLYVMTYEQHWENSDPGSVAALPWMRSIMAYARRLIPADKLFGGLPMYGYDWPAGQPATGLTYAQVQTLINTHQPEVQWDDQANSWSFNYQQGVVPHTVWFEDARSAAAKHQLFQQFGVGNAAVWRLGNEDPRLWQILTPSPPSSPGSG